MSLIQTKEEISYHYIFQLDLKELEHFLSQVKEKKLDFTQVQIFSMRMLTTISQFILNELNVPAVSDGTAAQYGKLEYDIYYLEDYNKTKQVLDNLKNNLTSIVQDCSAFHFNDIEKFNQYFSTLFHTFKLEQNLISSETKSKKHKV